jgi:hypothetical protein
MQKWHDDFVKPKDQGGQGREPTNEEIAQKRADLVQTERPPGQVAQNIGERVMIAGNDVAKALTAVAALPGGTTLGLFGGAQAALGPDLGENVKKAMANSATPQSSQLLQALSNGLGRSLATLAAAGAGQGVQMLAEQMKADMPEANDTGLTIAMKMADIRQITDAALEVLQTDKRLNAGQQAKIGQMLEQVHKAVPFETVDVARLASSGSPDDFAAFYKRLGLGAGGRQPIASGPDVAPPPNVRPPIAGREQPSGAATEGGTATTGTITPGTTKRNPKDGKLYVFKGGDQYDQRNWVEAPEGAVEAE